MNKPVSDPHATLPDLAQEKGGRDLLHNFFPVCKRCGHPYASNFVGVAHGLTSQPVCNGSMVHGLCKPVIYMMFPHPPEALALDISLNGERFRGMLYKMAEERDNEK